MKFTPENKVERVAAKDFEEIVEVWEASIRATHHFLREEDIVFYKPLILNEYLKAVNLFCIRDEQGKINGFLGTFEDKIEMLFLKPASRGKGIGKILLKHAIEKQNIKKVDVNEQNLLAIGFYEHLGFKVVSRLEMDSMGKPYPILSMELI